MLRIIRSGLLFLLATGAALAAAGKPLVIVYPDAAGPERELIGFMREGIRAEASRRNTAVVELAVDAFSNGAALKARLETLDPSDIIALGKRASELTGEAQPRAPLLVAGVKQPVSSTGPPRGISSVVDPRLMLQTLHELAPGIRRVNVVIDSARDGWIKDPAATAARALGLEILFHEAGSVKEAAKQFSTVLGTQSRPEFEALWLLEDRTLVTQDTLPAIIEKSWARRIVVFSSVYEHVRKGALFTLAPDPRAWGRRLAREALGRRTVPDAGMSFLEDVHRVGNARMATHLSGMLDSGVLARFEVMVGAP